MIYLLMVPAMAAAIWAWRLAEASNKRLKADLLQANFAAEKWQHLYNNKQIDLMELRELSKKHAQSLKWDIEKNEDLEKVRGDYKAMVKNCSDLVDRIEQLRNEIDGLNIDKLALKERLQKYEAAEQKRREQKRVGMQRYRANKKKGAKK